METIKKLLVVSMLALMIGGTAFGQSALSIVEALQSTFRSVSDTLLPSVVEVDITQTKTYTNPLGNITNPFEWFFPWPQRACGYSPPSGHGSPVPRSPPLPEARRA